MKTIVTNLMKSAIAEFPGIEIRYIAENENGIDVMFKIWNVTDFRAFRAHIANAAAEHNMTVTFDYQIGAIRGIITFKHNA